MTDKISKSGLLVASALVLVFSLPALGQQGPESLLPEGFGDPAPPQTPVPGRTAPNVPGSISSSSPSAATEEAAATEEGEEEEDPELVIRFDMPPAARQSLGAVGILPQSSGGFPANSFGSLDGAFLSQMLKRTSGPIASRWGTIMARRLLASRTNTPNGVNGADWTAERAWLLLRMGDSVVARNLVQQVDGADYTKRLHEVAMQAYLANGDLAGMCPITESGVRLVNNGRWKMTRAICASLAGEQGSATAFINQGRYQGWVRGVDYLLAEKAVGAGMNGRRSVKIEWENVEGMNPWRFGLSAAVGLEPPESLFADTGRQVDGWRVQLPMFSPTIRVKYASNAAALGILSNRNMVDLYAQLLDDPDAPDAARLQAESLGDAYTASGEDAKVAAMTSLWTTAAAGADYHASLVMTARAAALIVPDTDHREEADRLIASMLTAGLDRSAARWMDIVADGSLGWALVTLATPGRVTAADYGSLDDFFGNDDSTDGHKSRLLLAGLSGLGRIETDARADFASDLKVNISRQTAWSKAITAAAGRGEQGTVALMAVAALQAPSWSAVPANHLYYIVRSLRQVGLEAEARMIAAEAVTFA
ncbi:hypothetical protein [Sphingorhabdus sp. EL138]|uniref:hypothetical protein n=1 Tax=Sphingorhabdus sp. EL138 TaxID=2073156 RepID=UPI0025DDA5E8|nr:hypothetical protein [Sphingorhabdus sp. EL138]